MKLITDYEVYGNWSFEQNPNNICPRCGNKTEQVPKEGHFNSKYWKFKRNDGFDLYCCTNGCPVDFAKLIKDNSNIVDEKILKKFYFDNETEIDEQLLKDLMRYFKFHQKDVHYIFIRDFVLNYDGFLKFYRENFSDRPEFIWDRKSGIIFFNMYSHEGFKNMLYHPIYKTNPIKDDICEKLDADKRIIWLSRVSYGYVFKPDDLTHFERVRI